VHEGWTHDAGVPTSWCDVTDASDLRELLGTIATALGISLSAKSGRAASADVDAAFLQRLGSALAAEPRLLVIDNVDHLVPTARSTIAAWLGQAPELVVLASSREQLGIAHEHVFALEPLGLPTSESDVLESDAARLWLERVRARNPSYRVLPAEIPAIGQLVRELDGLPLAIELAAARATVLGPIALLARLDRRFEILRSTQVAQGSSKHHALRAAIDVSWESLEDAERMALEQASVFRGGFSLEAAEAVIETHSAAPSALDRIQRLCEKSLLTITTVVDLMGEQRFGFLLSLRAYAEDKLAPDERQRALDRHRRYHLRLAERCARELTVDKRAHVRLILERDNLNLAIRQSFEARDHEAVLRFFVALEAHHALVAWSTDELDLFREALRAWTGPDSRLVARALLFRSELHLHATGELEPSEADARRALAIARVDGDAALEAGAQVRIARALAYAGHRSEASDAANDAVALAARARDPAVEAKALLCRSMIARDQGLVVAALVDCESALVAARRASDTLLVERALGQLGLLLLQLGKLDEARALLQEALSLTSAFDSLDERLPVGRYGGLGSSAYFVAWLGAVELEADRLDVALSLFSEAISRALASSDRMLAANVRAWSAVAKWAAGRVAEARVELDDALPDIATGLTAYLPIFVAALAAIEAELDRLETARSRQVPTPNSEAQRHTVELCFGHLDLCEARRADRRGDPDAAALARARARARLDAACHATTAYAESSDIRVFTRLLERALEVRRPIAAVASTVPRTLRVAASGRWIECMGMSRVSCARRPVMRRLLVALTRAHLSQPARGVSAAELIEAGWPDQRMRAQSARDRLHMMISRIRDLGLRGVLHGDGERYRFADDLEICIEDDA
jgi:predicted ATPase